MRAKIELCERAGEMLDVPAILINGELVFSSVADELEYVIAANLKRQARKKVICRMVK